MLSRGHYHWQHEPAWYCVRGKGHWSGDCTQSTLWQIPNRDQDAAKVHGTQKPVECMRRPMLNNSAPGQGVYEPICGSGHLADRGVDQALCDTVTANADAHAAALAPIIAALQARGLTTLRALALDLNAAAMQTRRGGQWHVSTVRNLLARIADSAQQPRITS